MLLEDVAGLERRAPVADETEGRFERASVRRLAKARRRAIAVIVLDWAALLVLVFARAGSEPVLPLGATEDSIFALGLLAIAVHSGFRLGQLEKLAAVRRVLLDLADRERPVVEPPETA